MISPLGKGHRGGTLSITSSRGRGAGAVVGRAVGTLGPAPAVAAEGPTAVEKPAAAEEPAVEGSAAGGVGLWRTYGLKE